MKKLLLFPALTFIVTSAFSQTIYHIPLAGVADGSKTSDDWNPFVQNIEAPHPGVGAKGNEFQLAKDRANALHDRKKSSPLLQQRSPSVIPPSVNKNFQGNNFNGYVPNDNDVAISNGGLLTSVVNVTAYRYNTNTNTPLGTQALSTWCSVLGNTQTKFDPKVMYDPMADKFVMVCLAGFTSTATNIIVGFSQSNDPTGSWNLYSLPGNPLTDTSWTDFPMMSLSNKELFITCNLLTDTGTWQTGFKRTLIWQVRKLDGFSGQTLTTQLHSNIAYGGKKIRNLCPVKGGSTLYGPDMYFLSDRNFAVQNDTFFLVHVTDTINAPGQQLTVAPLISNQSYFVPPNASQMGNADKLATNDARVLGAFIENGMIQFTSNTQDTATGFSAVYYGRITSLSTTPVLTGKILGDPSLEFGYANLSYGGLNATDNTAIISFDHSGSTAYPGVSALTTDANGNYSTRTNVKTGLGYMNLLSGTERWGDYSGSQPRYNQPGTIWVSGLFSNASHQNVTWIAELSVFPSAVEDFPGGENAVLLYPNPAAESFYLEFEIGTQELMSFDIYNIEGQLVKKLLYDRVKAGKNKFYFNTEPLKPGVYFLRISSDKKNTPLVKKFVKM